MTAGQLPVAATATSVTSSIALPLAVGNGGTGSTTAAAALTALGAAPLNAPVFTGDARAVTPATADNDTSIATTGYVQAQGYATSAAMTAADALKAPLASPVFTGDPQAPTPATADSDTSIATTAFVKAQGYATSAAMTAADNLRVLKAGDTMTGSLSITPPSGNANLVLNKAGSGAGNDIYGYNGANLRWQMELGGATAESGGDAGSDFTLSRFADGGAYLGTPLTISRASGAAVFASSVTANGGLTSSGNAGFPAVLTGTTDSFIRYSALAGAQLYSIGVEGTTGDYWIYDATHGRLGIKVTAVSGACFNQTGTWTSLSDASIKEDVQPYTRGLDAIVALEPIQYRYQAGTPFAAENEASPLRFGLMAEAVREVIPEIVGETTGLVRGEARTLATLNNGDLIFSLINAVKELSVKVAALEGRPA
jgi:hypothetical protein